ncbi:hypothetical protein V22_31790 [Calycomorphotria hydatis]|uniref:Uncharacterized protein n=1 Tax=Calycomorphotria hydatis TaxID=2528027 RepID=A0A517TC11_9PLAN|nr:hypothetical protein V22_31790 [Calycomorphotria hydatis]
MSEKQKSRFIGSIQYYCLSYSLLFAHLLVPELSLQRTNLSSPFHSALEHYNRWNEPILFSLLLLVLVIPIGVFVRSKDWRLVLIY